MDRSDTESDLLRAAQEVERELEKLDALARSGERGELRSRAHLEQAAKRLESVAQTDERLNAAVQRLVAAVQEARGRRQDQVARIAALAVKLQERTAVWKDLMERFAELGRAAASLNEIIQRLAQEPTPGGAAAVVEHMEGLAARAQSLAEDAAEVEFDDVAQQADSLRQQLLSARNKLRLVHEHNLPQA